MEVKPGYKKTEVGAIPEEWDVVNLEFAAGIIDPQPDHRTPPECTGGDPYIGISDFLDDHTINWDESRKIVPRAVDKQRNRFQIRSGDIIFGKIGTIGMPKFAPAPQIRYGLSANVLLLQPICEPYFLMAWLRSDAFQIAVNAELHSTSQAAFGINKMRRMRVPTPPEVEQRAIASALSDVDGLLEGLERLIGKKRDLKRAAMQQLLTGQTRLSDFRDGWELKGLHELADIRSGGTPSTAVPHFWDGDIPWCTPTDITALDGRKYLGETARKITAQGLESSSAEIIPPRSVVMTSRATIGECAINSVPVSTNQGFKSFVPFASTDVEFLFYLLQTQKQGFIRLCGGSTFLEIGKAQLADYRVRVPAVKEEQTAIAEVLADMDAELAGLEQRREKTRNLKQAMMQELLTGRTRLLSPDDAHA